LDSERPPDALRLHGLTTIVAAPGRPSVLRRHAIRSRDSMSIVATG